MSTDSNIKPLSPLFKPTDFYYYNAQFPSPTSDKFPYGTNFLLSILGIDLNTDDILTGNANTENKNINASFITYDGSNEITIDPSSGAYSIPFQLVKEKCQNKVQLYNDISAALHHQFENEPDITDLSGSTNNDRLIEYGNPKSVSIKDICNNIHTYYTDPSAIANPANYIHLNQNNANNFYDDVSLNVTSTYANYKKVEISNTNDDSVSTYYTSTNSGTRCYSKIGNSHFQIDANNNCSCTTTNDCTTDPNYALPINHDKKIDLFINNLTYMSFDAFPDYSSINVFNNPKNTTEPDPTIYDPSANELIQLIFDYFVSLCENQEKAEAYQYLVNQVTNSGTDELYKTTMDQYYREYQRILNISFGILISIGIIYQISK
jgi:hypothetical protein